MRRIHVAMLFACVVVFGLGVGTALAGTGPFPDDSGPQVPASDQVPGISGGQQYVFVGQTACVCGHFPTPESRQGLVIGEIPIIEPVSVSSTMIEFTLPEGVPPGRHSISGAPSAGFAPGQQAEIVVLDLSGSIDQDLLRSGQSTPMHIQIIGTEDRLELRLTNNTPGVVSIEGGDEGVVTTSGGAENTVERTVRGLRPGGFDIQYEVDNDPCPCPSAGETTAGDSPVRTGYPVPQGVIIGTPISTGRTTGVFANVDVTNNGAEPIEFPTGPVLVPPSGEHQGYIIPQGRATTIPPGTTRTVPLGGYCTDVRKPPVPGGESIPPPGEWVVPTDPTMPISPRPDADHLDEGPEIGLLGGIGAIERATEELQEDGELQTPFSGDPERERETVVQQTFWRFAAERDGRPYTREEFGERLEEQYEEQTGTPITSAPEEDRERLEQGADDFWDAFELVGERAKVLDPRESVPVSESVPPTEIEEPPCDIERSMEHSEAQSEFVMSESYKDEDQRAELSEMFGGLPEIADEPEGGTFEAGRYPASSWAVAGRDFIGGYTNAVAKHVFREADGGSDLVWSTDLIEVNAQSNGTHTMTVQPPPGEDCETLVVGAGGGMVEAWSNGIDPIADHRGILTALRIVRDVSLAVATGGASLAVGLGTMAATMAFDEAFSADADAAAAAEGQMRIQVRRRRIDFEARSRSTLSGDGTLDSGASQLVTGETSDTHRTTITVTTDGRAGLKSRASGNGVAEATVESQVGVAIVAFCRCGGGVQVEYLTDAGLFLVEEGAANAATRTAQRLEEMVGEIIEPYLELPAEQVIPTALEDLPTDLEQMLRLWYLENGSDENQPGYFPITKEMVKARNH